VECPGRCWCSRTGRRECAYHRSGHAHAASLMRSAARKRTGMERGF
jgi:hypothetical protein